jgi:osmotically-inducible protein OsmY
MTRTQPRTDSELKSALVDELKWIPDVDSTHIGIAVNGGAVTLSGEVDSYPEKLLAAKAVMRVKGVTAIAQEITVRDPGAGVSDTDIAREAGEALRRAVDVPETVRASVHDHVITLSGDVQGQFERSAAARAVRYTRGVRSVTSSIVIRSAASTKGIKTAITAALVRSALLEGLKITVTPREAGEVELEGAVRSWTEHRQAELVAWSAPGITTVVNNLRVQY